MVVNPVIASLKALLMVTRKVQVSEVRCRLEKVVFLRWLYERAWSLNERSGASMNTTPHGLHRRVRLVCTRIHDFTLRLQFFRLTALQLLHLLADVPVVILLDLIRVTDKQ